MGGDSPRIRSSLRGRSRAVPASPVRRSAGVELRPISARRRTSLSSQRAVLRGSAPGVSAAAGTSAIDLYSGIGGWTLGLGMAGIRTLASFEWWGPANRTHARNFGREFPEVDIRRLDPGSLPAGVDMIVGSPPCTQFSFSNRGGGGDIADGLRDVAKFLEVVAHVRPRHWVMENVPRVAGLLERELGFGGELQQFASLVKTIAVVDMADFGLPQSRRRMLAGDFPLDVLMSYRTSLPRRTLGEVITALAGDPVRDPIYGIELGRECVSGLELEPVFTEEEVRMNSEAKGFHPIYNRMSFPDRLDRPARTVTATCTRVSRESIVIAAPGEPGHFRRLTLRERASLQGFPITFQFWGSSHSENLTLVGNALPPLMSYYVAHSLLHTAAEKMPVLSESYRGDSLARAPAAVDVTVAQRYPRRRRFRAAIPHLRFGSGMRFELVNDSAEASVSWGVNFYFGTSKQIGTVILGAELLERLLGRFPVYENELLSSVRPLEDRLRATSPADLQEVWSHRATGVHPFEAVDELGRAAKRLFGSIGDSDSDAIACVQEYLEKASGATANRGRQKIARNAGWILAGFLVSSWFNSRSAIARSRNTLPLAG